MLAENAPKTREAMIILSFIIWGFMKTYGKRVNQIAPDKLSFVNDKVYLKSQKYQILIHFNPKMFRTIM